MVLERVRREEIPPAVYHLCAALRRGGHGVWIVGGCVRDHLLARAVTDWDLCTTARPEQLMKIFPRAIPTGIEHGTVTVMVDHVGYEVTTLRGEVGYSDGRRPDSVYFVEEIDADLARRDFTINAIAYDLDHDVLVDPHRGRADLERGIVRAVGLATERFAEDGLRVLRAARFVATLEFQLDAETEAAVRPNLETYKKVSPERVREEWLKTMKAREPSRAFEVMLRTGILGVTLPEMETLHGCMQNRHHEYDVWTHTMRATDYVPVGQPLLRVAALLHDIAKPRTREVRPNGEATFLNHEHVGAEMAEEFLNRYRFSNDERLRITHLIRNHLVAYDAGWSDAAVRRFIKRVGTDALRDLLVLCRADSRAKGSRLGDDLERLETLEKRAADLLAAGAAMSVKDLAIDGNDLQRELGIPPSRRIGDTLRMLLDRVLDDPALNERGRLLELARASLEKSAGPT